MDIHGMLLIDKPKDWTSFDVVNFVRRNIATKLGKKPKHVKVGHTGTLDPSATGLLILMVGSWCKRAQSFSKLDKSYQATFRFGYESTTGDGEGELTAVSDQIPTDDQVIAACASQTGLIWQEPPAYSAIKIDGKRAYDLARQGVEVVIPRREVTVYQLQVVQYQYPDLQISTRVSSGTYIRTIGQDIGRELGTGAYTTELRRTTVGAYSVTGAVTPEEAVKDIVATITSHTAAGKPLMPQLEAGVA